MIATPPEYTQTRAEYDADKAAEQAALGWRWENDPIFGIATLPKPAEWEETK